MTSYLNVLSSLMKYRIRRNVESGKPPNKVHLLKKEVMWEASEPLGQWDTRQLLGLFEGVFKLSFVGGTTFIVNLGFL